jgi:hypothetical protein
MHISRTSKPRTQSQRLPIIEPNGLGRGDAAAERQLCDDPPEPETVGVAGLLAGRGQERVRLVTVVGLVIEEMVTSSRFGVLTSRLAAPASRFVRVLHSSS